MISKPEPEDPCVKSACTRYMYDCSLPSPLLVSCVLWSLCAYIVSELTVIVINEDVSLRIDQHDVPQFSVQLPN